MKKRWEGGGEGVDRPGEAGRSGRVFRGPPQKGEEEEVKEGGE